MSRKKKSKRRNPPAEKLNSATNVSRVSGRRGLNPAIITMASIVIAVAVWLGLQSSSVRSGVESAATNQPGQVAADSNQSAGAVTGGPSIHVPEPSHDFGTISQGTKVTHTFAVKNTGDEPLKLIKAKAS